MLITFPVFKYISFRWYINRVFVNVMTPQSSFDLLKSFLLCYSIKLNFICITHSTMDIITKQLHRYIYIYIPYTQTYNVCEFDFTSMNWTLIIYLVPEM